MEQYLVFENRDQALKIIPLNEKRLIKAAGISICIARIKSGLVAFRNECPHMGEGLSKGHINHLEEITCPWHAYRFSLKNGDEVERRCAELKFINVREISGKVYLEF